MSRHIEPMTEDPDETLRKLESRVAGRKMAKRTTPTIRFTVPAIPIAQPRQRHRVVVNGGRTYTMNYTPAKSPVTDFKATVRLAAAEAYSGPPLEGPVTLTAVFVLPRPRAKVWRTKSMPRYLHSGKPDLDNLLKSLKDSLGGLVWRDDSQVASCSMEKWVAAGDEQPHVVVELTAATAATEER